MCTRELQGLQFCVAVARPWSLSLVFRVHGRSGELQQPPMASTLTAKLAALSAQRRKATVTPTSVAFPLPTVPSVDSKSVVTRRDIRELSDDEQERFCDALDQMMKPGWAARPDSGVPAKFPSEFFRLASYHGAERNGMAVQACLNIGSGRAASRV